MNTHRQHNSGFTIILAIALLAILVFSLGALVTHVTASSRATQTAVAASQTFQIAEAGLNHALAQLASDANYHGEGAVNFAGGNFQIEVSDGSGGKVIRATSHWQSPSRNFSQTITATLRAGKIGDWQQSRLTITPRA